MLRRFSCACYDAGMLRVVLRLLILLSSLLSIMCWVFAIGVSQSYLAGPRLRGEIGWEYGTLVTLLAVPPVVPVGLSIVRQVRRMRSESRHFSHQCQVCGYDLRATPDRCPECGAISKQG